MSNINIKSPVPLHSNSRSPKPSLLSSSQQPKRSYNIDEANDKKLRVPNVSDTEEMIRPVRTPEFMSFSPFSHIHHHSNNNYGYQDRQASEDFDPGKSLESTIPPQLQQNIERKGSATCCYQKALERRNSLTSNCSSTGDDDNDGDSPKNSRKSFDGSIPITEDKSDVIEAEERTANAPKSSQSLQDQKRDLMNFSGLYSRWKNRGYHHHHRHEHILHNHLQELHSRYQHPAEDPLSPKDKTSSKKNSVMPGSFPIADTTDKKNGLLMSVSDESTEGDDQSLKIFGEKIQKAEESDSGSSKLEGQFNDIKIDTAQKGDFSRHVFDHENYKKFHLRQ
ncbi:hypothetical protein DASC09_003120 [Saccharomycopsis crataegensis]|uniref:Uncharacterized protein n=1 Tax=Saccharomycopsis crataegensis TaxID=43959 RepID=A0AAV5QEE4_9ASCO|nr:hypothetical protein DASC09_003120 [Saccharomycopsis crataegensis]